jgi:ArsR family metal-binding transcriptional regulator
MEPLIKDYHPELEEDHHHPGSGRFSLVINVKDDISPAMPYLNAMLDDPQYDHENKILIGAKNGQRYAFRPHEIRTGAMADADNMHRLAAAAVGLVNEVWANRESIAPSLKVSKLPAAFEIYRLLPKTNCRECGCASCLAFAAELRGGNIRLEQCTLLASPEHEKSRRRILALFAGDSG